jgi:hypothetical protein
MKLPLLAVTVLAANLLSGCGGTKTTRLNTRRVPLTLDEYRILPRQLDVPAGRLRIVAHNRGILTHKVTIELEHLDSNGNTVTVASTPTIFPGQTVSLLTEALKPGRYTLVSPIANQVDLGMSATLIVR